MRDFFRAVIYLLLLTVIQLGPLPNGSEQMGLLHAAPLSNMEVGFASWYGGKFQGRHTASGERFDTNKLTAAHKTLPFGTIVRVTNLENNLSVEVRINDRGPFIKGRIIDLSRAAADAIGMAGKGIALVKVEPIGPELERKRIQEQYVIQIGAYIIHDNALRAKERVEKLGLHVDLEVTSSKVTRVVVSDITSVALENVKKRLRQAGFTHLLVKIRIED